MIHHCNVSRHVSEIQRLALQAVVKVTKMGAPVDEPAEDKPAKVLDADDIRFLKTYGLGPYSSSIKTIEQDLKDIQKRVVETIGIKESDTGLAPPSRWDLVSDKQMLYEEQPLQVWCKLRLWLTCAQAYSTMQPDSTQLDGIRSMLQRKMSAAWGFTGCAGGYVFSFRGNQPDTSVRKCPSISLAQPWLSTSLISTAHVRNMCASTGSEVCGHVLPR